MSDQAEPYTIELRRETFVLTDDEAATVRHAYLDAVDEDGSGYGDGIRCPDGTVYTRRDWPGDDWSSLSAAEEQR